MHFILEMNVHLAVKEVVSLVGMSELQMSSHEKDVWWPAVKMSCDYLEPRLISWTMTAGIRRLKP